MMFIDPSQLLPGNVSTDNSDLAILLQTCSATNQISKGDFTALSVVYGILVLNCPGEWNPIFLRMVSRERKTTETNEIEKKSIV